ncbi:MAG: EscU/YscU/HrcU family type III secretion system export apparatus switch protein [Acidimicrobiales bacterium]
MASPDKTEKPTAKRLKKARSKGQIARSPEIVSWALLLLLSFLGPLIFQVASPLFVQLFLSFYNLTHGQLTSATALIFLERGFQVFVEVVLLAAGAGFVLSLLGSVAQVGFNLSPSVLGMKFSRLSPAKNIKKIFSGGGFFELAKSVIKLTLVALIAWLIIHAKASALASGQLSLSEAIADTVSGSVTLLQSIAVVGLALGIADYAHQKHKITKSLYMTKQEVKDEHKESDGDPAVKGRIRRLQRQMTRQRMMRLVPEADVVVVNPTHYAVAIKYDPRKALAPVVVAKGSGHVAASIKRIAGDHTIPIVRDPILARTMHATCEIGVEIPPVFFMAVARLLAFVYRLEGLARYYETSFHTSPADLPQDLVEKAAAMS